MVLRRIVGEPLRILRQIVGVFFPIDYEFVFFATGSLSTSTSKVNTQKKPPFIITTMGGSEVFMIDKDGAVTALFWLDIMEFRYQFIAHSREVFRLLQ